MKRFNLLILILSFALVLPSAPLFAAADQPAGVMTVEKGNIKVRRNNKDTIYKTPGEKVDLFNGDSLQTGANSEAKVFIHSKGDEIVLYSNSFLGVEDVSGDKRDFNMPIGKAHFKVKPLAVPLPAGAKRPFMVKTVNALVGVKGTEFVLGTGAETTSLLTLEGAVTMANVDSPGVEVVVAENQASQITKADPPTAPVKLSPAAVQQIMTTDSPQAFNAVKFGAPVTDTGEKKADKKEEKKEEKKQEEKKQEAKKEEAKKEEAKPGDKKEAKADAKPLAKEEAKADAKGDPKAGPAAKAEGPAGDKQAATASPGADKPVAAPAAEGADKGGSAPALAAGPVTAAPEAGPAAMAGAPESGPVVAGPEAGPVGAESEAGPVVAGPEASIGGDLAGGVDLGGGADFEGGADFGGDFGGDFAFEEVFFEDVIIEDLVGDIIDQVTTSVTTAQEAVIQQTTAPLPQVVTIEVVH